MPGRNEEYVEQIQIMTNNQREGEDNSPEFNLLNQTIRNLNERMTEMSQPDEESRQKFMKNF